MCGVSGSSSGKTPDDCQQGDHCAKRRIKKRIVARKARVTHLLEEAQHPKIANCSQEEDQRYGAQAPERDAAKLCNEASGGGRAKRRRQQRRRDQQGGAASGIHCGPALELGDDAAKVACSADCPEDMNPGQQQQYGRANQCSNYIVRHLASAAIRPWTVMQIFYCSLPWQQL